MSNAWKFLVRHETNPTLPARFIPRVNLIVWNAYPEGRSGLYTLMGYCYWQTPRSLGEVRNWYLLRAYWTPADRQTYREIAVVPIPANARRYRSGSFKRKITPPPRPIRKRYVPKSLYDHPDKDPYSTSIDGKHFNYTHWGPPIRPIPYTGTKYAYNNTPIAREDDPDYDYLRYNPYPTAHLSTEELKALIARNIRRKL